MVTGGSQPQGIFFLCVSLQLTPQDSKTILCNPLHLVNNNSWQQHPFLLPPERFYCGMLRARQYKFLLSRISSVLQGCSSLHALSQAFHLQHSQARLNHAKQLIAPQTYTSVCPSVRCSPEKLSTLSTSLSVYFRSRLSAHSDAGGAFRTTAAAAGTERGLLRSSQETHVINTTKKKS